MSDRCLLVDGVWNAVILPRDKDCVQIVLPKSGRVFEKRKETFNGMDVYRLKPYPWVTIRHVGLHFAE